MITFIAAIDDERGLANDHEIPWIGKIPTDMKHFREQTKDKVIIMGYKTYLEFEAPLSNRKNLVATHGDEPLRPGFERLDNVEVFLTNTKDDIWIIGGAGLFASTLSYAEVLDLTMIDGNFGCSKFFPDYTHDFVLTKKSEPIVENGVSFCFTIWKRKV